jgi:hypothetical protein
MRLVEAEHRACAFWPIAEAVPDLAFFVLGPAEQDAGVGVVGAPATSTSTASGSVKPVR